MATYNGISIRYKYTDTNTSGTKTFSDMPDTAVSDDTKARAFANNFSQIVDGTVDTDAVYRTTRTQVDMS